MQLFSHHISHLLEFSTQPHVYFISLTLRVFFAGRLISYKKCQSQTCTTHCTAVKVSTTGVMECHLSVKVCRCHILSPECQGEYRPRFAVLFSTGSKA